MKQFKKEVLKEARDRIMLVPEDFDDFLLEVIDLTVAEIRKMIEGMEKSKNYFEYNEALQNIIDKLCNNGTPNK